jgi:hypothetical protein
MHENQNHRSLNFFKGEDFDAMVTWSQTYATGFVAFSKI